MSHNVMWITELTLGVYSLTSFFVYFSEYHRAFSFFLLLYAIGFLLTGWLSRPKRDLTAPATADQVRPLIRSSVASVESASGS